MLIIIKQNKEVVKIFAKRYDPHKIETDVFLQFIRLTKPFIQSTSGSEERGQFKFS